jgi:ATP/maltotriose-dependent transcriptional regulator MalT
MAPDRDQFDRTVNTVHAKLGEAACAKAWAEGQAMTLEQAIEEAMRIEYPLYSAQLIAPIEPLNERELEILQLIANGLSNHEIAERLVIALSTVKWHINNLFGKLGVRSRTQALVRAKELALL